MTIRDRKGLRQTQVMFRVWSEWAFQKIEQSTLLLTNNFEHRTALEHFRNNIERATDYLLNNPPEADRVILHQ